MIYFHDDNGSIYFEIYLISGLEFHLKTIVATNQNANVIIKIIFEFMNNVIELK